jgi:hypothetical protein
VERLIIDVGGVDLRRHRAADEVLLLVGDAGGKKWSRPSAVKRGNRGKETSMDAR